jgi:hypothetical protein
MIFDQCDIEVKDDSQCAQSIRARLMRELMNRKQNDQLNITI